MRKLIEIKNLVYIVKKNIVLDNINLNIFEKDFIAVIGPNGSGKTTLMKNLIGLTQPSSGSIIYDENLNLKKQISYVPQSFQINENFPGTVKELLNLERISKKTLSLEKISNLFDLKFNDLSGGQKQKVMLTMATLNKPKLLILDEPLTGVDQKSQQEFFDELSTLKKQGVTIMMVTHNFESIPKEVNRIVCINQKICLEGKLKDLTKIVNSMFNGIEHTHV